MNLLLVSSLHIANYETVTASSNVRCFIGSDVSFIHTIIPDSHAHEMIFGYVRVWQRQDDSKGREGGMAQAAVASAMR